MTAAQLPHPTPILPYHQSVYPAIEPTNPSLSTAGKSIFITGAGTGIGAQIAQSFAASGAAHIALVGRRIGPLESTKATINAAHPSVTVHVIPGDVTSTPSITSAVQTFASAVPGGKIDILVANAGYVNKVQPLAETDEEDWWRVFEINVKGNYNLLKAFSPAVAADKAVVLHVSSTMAHLPYVPGYAAYQASKLAAIPVFEHWRKENGGRRVVQFHPGLYRTEIGSTTEDLGLSFDDLSLVGGFAVWAASDEAAFLDGKFVWAHWDVETMKAKKDEIASDPYKWTIGLLQWP